MIPNTAVPAGQPVLRIGSVRRGPVLVLRAHSCARWDALIPTQIPVTVVLVGTLALQTLCVRQVHVSLLVPWAKASVVGLVSAFPQIETTVELVALLVLRTSIAVADLVSVRAVWRTVLVRVLTCKRTQTTVDLVETSAERQEFV